MKKLGIFLGSLAGISGYLILPYPERKKEGEPYQFLPRAGRADNPNKHFLTQVPIRIGIIGGGISGCITAKTLSQQGYDVEVLDKNGTFGGLWYISYDSSGLQFPYTHYNLPDFTFPQNSDLIPSGPQVKKFITAYADKFNLRPLFRFYTEVSKIQQNPDLS